MPYGYQGKPVATGLGSIMAIDGASSSGVESRRFVFDNSLGVFAGTALFSGSTAVTVTLFGSVATSSDATGTSLLSWSTASGLTQFTTGGQPVNQVWAEVSTMSSSGSVTFWFTGGH